MSHEILHLTPPNICCLIYDSTQVVFVETSPESAIGPFDGYTGFEQFTTLDEAASRAVELDPNFDLNLIYGALIPLPLNLSPQIQNVYEGESVTFNSEFACLTDVEYTVSYRWYNPGGLIIPGATESSLTLNSVTSGNAGVYNCKVDTLSVKGQTGSSTGTFKVTVYPAITPGAVAE